MDNWLITPTFWGWMGLHGITRTELLPATESTETTALVAGDAISYNAFRFFFGMLVISISGALSALWRETQEMEDSPFWRRARERSCALAAQTHREVLTFVRRGAHTVWSGLDMREE